DGVVLRGPLQRLRHGLYGWRGAIRVSPLVAAKPLLGVRPAAAELASAVVVFRRLRLLGRGGAQIAPKPMLAAQDRLGEPAGAMAVWACVRRLLGRGGVLAANRTPILGHADILRVLAFRRLPPRCGAEVADQVSLCIANLSLCVVSIVVLTTGG